MRAAAIAIISKTTMARFYRDLRQLMRRLDSLFSGQVRISMQNDFDGSQTSEKNHSSDESSDVESSCASFYVEITPHDGLYAHASYVFHILTDDEYCYPDCAPLVSCLTRIYHPNIDTSFNNFHDNVCVSLLNDWHEDGNECTLEDLVQALLFLFYHPNLEDPLTSNVSCDSSEYTQNVRISIEGGWIEDFDSYDFPVNYGYQRYLHDKEREVEEKFLHMSLQETSDEQVIIDDRS